MPKFHVTAIRYRLETYSLTVEAANRDEASEIGSAAAWADLENWSDDGIAEDEMHVEEAVEYQSL